MPHSDEEFAAAVAQATSLTEVCRKLGLVPGGSFQTIRRRIARLGLDASHLPSLTEKQRSPSVVRRWTDEELRSHVAASTSIAEVLRRLGYQPSAGMYRYIKVHFTRLRLGTSHFTGSRWWKVADPVGRPFQAQPLEEILVRNSTYTRTSRLRERLIREGYKETRCEGCGLDEWLGQPMPLTLDHINGDHTDHRLENLRILCPNCHALTETWCGRNKGADVAQLAEAVALGATQ